ncbi:MAG: hypothetical protein CSA70_07550 [Rhodobacterales bacterium]|nr:MAG: hypothetical protein CSA70_07550 [Rhodobacterales bacterium]
MKILALPFLGALFFGWFLDDSEGFTAPLRAMSPAAGGGRLCGCAQRAQPHNRRAQPETVSFA